LNQIAIQMLALPRPAKRIVAFAIDSALCILTVWLAFGLRFDKWPMLTVHQLLPMAVALVFALPLFTLFGVYRAIFRYVGSAALIAIAQSMLAYGILYAAIFTMLGVSGVPRTVGIVQPLLLLFFVVASRLIGRYWLGGHYKNPADRAKLPRVLIFGAGSAGRQIAAALVHNRNEMTVVGFVDDDTALHGNTINELPVFGMAGLDETIRRFNVTDILLAIPSVGRSRRNEILAALQPYSLRVRTLPALSDLANGRVEASDVRDLDIEDLLGREPVAPDTALLKKEIRGRVVLVTGAGGSIGSELCRQIIRSNPAILLLVERSEYALYTVHQELENYLADKPAPRPDIIPLLASVCDFARMSDIMATWRPNTVYHAAAYKHVPLVEHNPAEGIRNNTLGTLQTARAALQNNVGRFILVSTDKAVRPTNVMGASKRLAEMVLQGLARTSPARRGGHTQFSMVRFGNVLGSSGSVVPLFRKQIINGGPITLTHSDITRYFMTIPEAAQLVLQAASMAKGGDVFVLDMGEPVRIYDLACRMIRLSGLTVKDETRPDGDIEVVVTGLRPGEKLYEELLIGGNPEATQHPRIMRANEECLPWAMLEEKLHELEAALDANDIGTITALMRELVSDYRPSGEIVDWIHLAQEAETENRARSAG
jgi:FlaA1/EpsC-like NDP-sugar epimerase